MKIVLWVYAISWLLMLLILLPDFIKKTGTKRKNVGRKKEPWYNKVLFILFLMVIAPVAIFYYPVTLVQDRKNKKEEQRLKVLREEYLKQKANQKEEDTIKRPLTRQELIDRGIDPESIMF